VNLVLLLLEFVNITELLIARCCVEVGSNN